MKVERLLPLLVCPLTRGKLELLPERCVLMSPLAGVAYPVRDGVPLLLADAAIDWPPPA